MSTATLPQHLAALNAANEVRIAQAVVFRRIRSVSRIEGLRLVASILRDPDELEGSIRLDRLLGAIHRHQARATASAMRCAGVPAGKLSKRVRDLTERQRHALAAELTR